MKWKRGKKAQQEARLAAQQQHQQLKRAEQHSSPGSTSSVQVNSRLASASQLPLLLARPSAGPFPASASFNESVSLLPLVHQQQQAGCSNPSPAHSSCSGSSRTSGQNADQAEAETISADLDEDDEEDNDEESDEASQDETKLAAETEMADRWLQLSTPNSMPEQTQSK